MSGVVARIIGQAFRRWLFRLTGRSRHRSSSTSAASSSCPRGAGLAFGMTLILLLIGSINYFLSLGLHADLPAGRASASSASCMLSAIWCGWRSRRAAASRYFAGETAMFPLLIRNARPDRATRHCACCARRRAWQLSVDVPGDATAEATLRSADPRARLAAAATGHPRHHLSRSGLIRAWSYVQPDMRCLVYPTPETDAPPLPLGCDGRRARQARLRQRRLSPACAATSRPTRRATSPGRPRRGKRRC